METSSDFVVPPVVAHYSPEREERGLLVSINATFRATRDSLEAEAGLRLGLGICRGTVIYGRFGTAERLTVTAFGAPVICAYRLAEEERTLAVCERLAADIADTLSPEDPWISVHAHWSSRSS